MDQASAGVAMIGHVDSAVRAETVTTQAPHNAVKAELLSVFAGSRPLLVETELKIAEQVRTLQVQAATGEFRSQKCGTCHGLVGPNGCGKSTLLRLLRERQVPVPAGWDVLLVSQHLPAAPQGRTPVEEVLSAAARRTQLLARQAELQEELAAPGAAEDAELVQRAGDELQALQSELAGWDGAAREASELLVALGFLAEGEAHVQGSEPTVATPMEQLSGGWRMKVELAKALWVKPKLLLLDEPTNHLDFKALRWLERRLEEYPHTSVVVSHDVSFLHSVCREILWIKDCKLETLPRDTVTQEDLIRMQRRKALRFHFQVPEGSVAADHGLSLHGVEFGYGGSSGSGQPAPFCVKDDVRFSGSSRAVVLGRNGCGKSTFLKLCVGDLQPNRGQVDRTPELQVGYYSQLTEELDQHPRDTAAAYLVRRCREALAAHAGSTRGTRLREALAAKAGKAEEEVRSGAAAPEPSAAAGRAAKALAQEKRLLEVARATLSHFGFEGDLAVSVPIECLSGGQKACLKFAVLSLTPCHILMLDEPTNHLDAEACEALARGLSEFEGGVVAVTHDELLIYRLINCNWSSSELLVCRTGCLRRLRNFGAGCLDALKKEVRGAEDEEEAAGPRQRASAARAARKEPAAADAEKHTRTAALPPWLARAPRQRKEAAAAVEGAGQGSRKEAQAVATAAPGAPAEQSAAKPQPKMQPTDGTAPAAARRLVGLPERKPVWPARGSALDAPTPSRAWARSSAPAASAQAPSEPQAAAPVPVPAAEEAPDSWEDIEEEAAEEEDPPLHGPAGGPQLEPEDCRPPVVVAAPAAPMRQDAKQEGKTPTSKSSAIAAPLAARAEGGRHSRSRKDLVNLNKAVIKWLEQEARGETSREEVVSRIRNSLVADRLREVNGSGFQEASFVKEVLERAAAAGVGTRGRM